MIIDCVSDLHGFYPQMKGGDLLIVAGDLTASDKTGQYLDFRQWIRSQNYRKKIVVFGNHDMAIFKGDFYFNPEWFGADCLVDEGLEFEGLKIWGCPWTLTFKGINPCCTAYTGTEDEIAEHYELIDQDTDILITHGPAQGVLDKTNRDFYAGSDALRTWLEGFGRPKLHVHGHIHEAYGDRCFFPETKSINCSHVNGYYEPVNPPIRIVL